MFWPRPNCRSHTIHGTTWTASVPPCLSSLIRWHTPTIFFADDKVYLPVNHVDISLYTALKSPETEARVEEALDRADIPWNKTETFIDSEHCYQIIYEIEV